MFNMNVAEANLILEVLSRYHQELETISTAGNRLTSSGSAGVDEYRRRLVCVKAEVKSAAKHGTVDGISRPQTELERCFYGPAVQHASSHFSLRTDAPPAKWLGGLYDPADDISYYIHGLQKLLEETSSVG